MAKFVIIGGVAGGASTAARLRRIDENAQIIMFERGEYISYANCGLPYYIGNIISERKKLFVQTPASFNARFNIDIRVNSEAVKINRAEKKIEIKNIKTGETYFESYDKLLLSPGAEPIKPPISGIDSEGIFTMRNVPDTDKIKSWIDERKPKHAVVIGGGFIGLEMAENLHHIGIEVCIVEMAPQMLVMFDPEMASYIHRTLKNKKIRFYLNDGVASFENSEGKIIVKTAHGREINTDMVILSIGVRPESKIAANAGLAIGDRGGIDVNEYMQTSDPDIYAVGDAVLCKNPVTGKKVLTYLAGPANKQGRIAADNIVFGNKVKYRGSHGTAILKLFELEAGITGVNEKTLKDAGIPYQTAFIYANSHAGYYPGAQMIALKVLFSTEDGRVYGGQAVGQDGVDKRIEMISAVIKQAGTIYDLAELDQAYAPPFSSAKDPVNMVGFVAQNIMQGITKTIQWHEIDSLNLNEVFLLDVRTAAENSMGTIKGSVNIPVDSIRLRINEIPKNKKIVIFCAAGLRGYIAQRILVQHGYEEVYNLPGGYNLYSNAAVKQDWG